MINVTFPQPIVKSKLSMFDLVDGRAYIVKNNEYDFPTDKIFICNKYQNAVLFSIDGKLIVTKDTTDLEFEEVDLEVKVSYK